MPTSDQDRQRRAVAKRKERIALMSKIPCACGCGTLIAPVRSNLTPNRYVKGHQTRMHPSHLKGKRAHNRIGDTPLSGAEIAKRHRERRYAEIAEMEQIPCACGCGTLIAPFNKKLKSATYAHGHNPIPVVYGRPSYWKGKKNPRLIVANKNRARTPEEIAKRTASRYAKYGPSYGAARGFKRSPEQIAQMSARSKTLVGEKNPFYGKTHTPEERVRMSERLSGDKHPNWRGGAATLPYGPEFTRKFKHLIRQRDNYTCQRCGKTQEQEGRVLQVHHLDHNKQNNDPSNLVTSCGSCNVWASYHRDEPFTL